MLTSIFPTTSFSGSPPLNLHSRVEQAHKTILGLDPGTATLGFAVIEWKESSWKIRACDCLHTDKMEPMEKRILSLYKGLGKLFRIYQPDSVACEELYFNKNTRTAFSVGSVIGIITLLAAQKKVSIYKYSPPQVKMAITGYGRATKIQVKEMLKLLLGCSQLPSLDDATDALAVALCHAYAKKFKDKVLAGET